MCQNGVNKELTGVRRSSDRPQLTDNSLKISNKAFVR